VVPVVGREHSHRPQRAHGARGDEGRGRGHLCGPGHARGPTHCGRLGLVVAADRRRRRSGGRTGIASRFDELVEHTNRGGSAVVRSPPRRARYEVRSTVAFATCNCSTPWRSRNSPTSIRAARWPRDRHAGRGRILALLNVRTELHRGGRPLSGTAALLSTLMRSALRCNIGDRFDLARMLSDAARTVSYYVDAGLRTAANALPRQRFGGVQASRAPSSGRGASSSSQARVILARDARPDRDPGLILRVAAASATTGFADRRRSTLARLTESAPEAAHAVASPGAQGSAGDEAAGQSAVATIESLDRTGVVGKAVPRVGRCARSTSARRRAYLDRRPPPCRNRLAGKCIHDSGVSRPDLLVPVTLCTTSARAVAGTTASSGRVGHPDRQPGWACGRRTSNCCRRWCAITCCCHTPRRDAIYRTRRPIAVGGRRARRRPGALGAPAGAGRGGFACDRSRCGG